MALFVAHLNTTKDLFCRTFQTRCYQELGFQIGIMGCQSNGSRCIWYCLWPKRRLLQIIELWRSSWGCFPWGVPERLVQSYICSLAWHIFRHGSMENQLLALWISGARQTFSPLKSYSLSLATPAEKQVVIFTVPRREVISVLRLNVNFHPHDLTGIKRFVTARSSL